MARGNPQRGKAASYWSKGPHCDTPAARASYRKLQNKTKPPPPGKEATKP